MDTTLLTSPNVLVFRHVGNDLELLSGDPELDEETLAVVVLPELPRAA